MGRAAVKKFVQEGFTVFAADITDIAAGENVIPIKLDVTDEGSVKKAFERVKGQVGELYGIVHLAGVYTLDSLVEMDKSEFERAFKINLFGAFLVNKTFLPLLKDRSRIVLVTSELAALDPLPFTGIYGITKTALDKYAYSLKMELQLNGIFVSVLRAGAVDTGMIGVSTRKLDEFCAKTKRYDCNAKRFKEIVGRVEARKIPPEKLAQKLYKIASASNPRFAYSINRNPLLIMLEMLPKRARFYIIKKVLSKTYKK